MARLAMTSLAFMLVLVPEPTWNTSISPPKSHSVRIPGSWLLIKWAIPDCCERWKGEGKSAQEVADEVLALVRTRRLAPGYYNDFDRFIDDVRAHFMDGAMPTARVVIARSDQGILERDRSSLPHGSFAADHTDGEREVLEVVRVPVSSAVAG